jgi:hypothetical protein
MVWSGMALGLALAIRPTEAPWVLVWFVVAWMLRERPENGLNLKAMLKIAAPLLASLSLVLLLACFVSWKTYGHPFVVGYLLRDPLLPISNIELPHVATTFSPRNILPFGLHPRAMWFNIKQYLFGYLGPWMLLAFVALVVSVRKKEARWVIALGVWTFGMMLLVYGQSVYQDSVGPHLVGTANSFLRYTLPLLPFFLLSVASLIAWIDKRGGGPRGHALAWLVVIGLGVFGTWSGLTRDSESVLVSSKELPIYQKIREQAVRSIPAGALVVSERSDKIFFPIFAAATPLPSKEEIKRAVRLKSDIYYFGSRVTGAETSKWTNAGLALAPVFQEGSQVLYRVSLAP